MGSDHEIRQRRVKRLVAEVVLPEVYPATEPLQVAVHFVPGEPITACDAYRQDFEPFSLGQAWGGAWSTAWFRMSGTIPPAWAGSDVVARIGLGYKAMTGFGGEALVWDGDCPLQAINPSHNSVKVASPAKGGDSVELHVEAAANPYVPWGGIEWPLLMPDYEGATLYRLDQAELAMADRQLESAWHDLRVLYELARALGPEARRSQEILRVLDRVALAVDPGAVRESVLAQAAVWAPLLDSPAAPGSHLVTAVGHAHIDSAWLWPIRETRRKCARTFSTALTLMEENPDYVFVCSQAQQHAWMEEHYPKLFEKMKAKVASGQFEPVGSMWIEPDTNMPSGESLVRQLVYGKRYFLERYGVETQDCWLPDAFGYSANLPQVLASAGVRYFLTQKLSWNEIDRFPHHTFWWEGIDGTRVLAHCPPTDTYNGDFSVAQVLKGSKDFAQHGASRHSLYAYGYGDGGGGPSQAMLDSYRRLRDLDPLPKVTLGTARSFFEAVEAEALAAQTATDAARPGTVTTAHSSGTGGLPVWVGELYLERHRAVQTTQAKTKLGNRRCEDLLRQAEMWAVAGLGAEYPQADLERAWQIVLLHQFHDILPGSSIHWVYKDSETAYATVREIATGVIDRACAAIASRVGGAEAVEETEFAGAGWHSVLVFNAGSHASTGLVELDAAAATAGGIAFPPYPPAPSGVVVTPTTSDSGTGMVTSTVPEWVAVPVGGTGGEWPVPVQVLDGGRIGWVASVPGCGWRRYDLVLSRRQSRAAGSQAEAMTAARARQVTEPGGETEIELGNGVLTVAIDSSGLLRSVLDVATGRELIAAGARGNVLQLHIDLPNDADAWDVDQGTFDRATELTELDSIEIVEQGPVRASVRIVRSFGKSRISQEIRLVAGARRLEFSTTVGWQERHRFLKVAFPVAIRAAFASYEVQFGYIQRPTHANTSWDAARFEVPAQRWADLSEPGAGVALLNDCKYGYDIQGSIIRLSLLRGPTWPDPEADLGEHRFSYALCPHGGLAASLSSHPSVVEQAEAFNLGLSAVPVPADQREKSLAATTSLIEVSGAMVSAVKRADRGDETIVRLWEPAGSHGCATVRVGVRSGLAAISAAETADSLERSLGPVVVDDGAVELPLRPFELVTLKLDGQR
ncbi:MAG: alpha-mannosidase [Acidimicrobiales bacterium]